MITTPTRATALLLNVAHALDHMFLLIFATAVAAIAIDFGFADWESLMPYGVGAFMLFGLGSLPAGRLGDLWGRRRMMLIFFFGMGASSLLVALTRNAWQLAGALTLLGAFSSIYHPVGIPMLVRGAKRPGLTIGINGLAGNLGVALAAVTTGLLVKYAGWRAAFVVAGVARHLPAASPSRVSRRGKSPRRPARRKRRPRTPRQRSARVFAVMTIAAISSQPAVQFHHQRQWPAAARALDRHHRRSRVARAAAGAASTSSRRSPRSPWACSSIAIRSSTCISASSRCRRRCSRWLRRRRGWALFACQIAFMIVVFGAIPFTDAMIVRYVDDRMRSRVSGMRLAVSFSVSSAAVWLLGPVVKAAGFGTLLLLMAGIAIVTLLAIAWLPPVPRGRSATATIVVGTMPQPTHGED